MDSHERPIVGEINMRWDESAVSTEAQVKTTTSLNHLCSGGTILAFSAEWW